MADPLDFDVTGARNAGFSDAAIADYLATKARYDVSGARKAGFADADIIGHLMLPPKAAEAEPEQASPPKKATIGDDLQRGLEQTRSSMQMLGADVAARHLNVIDEAKAKADRGEFLQPYQRWAVNNYEKAKANADRNLTESVVASIQHRKAAEDLPISPEYKAFREAGDKGAMDVVKAFWRAPGEVLTSMLAEGAIASTPALAAGFVGGPAAGALVAGGQGYVEGYASKVAELLAQRRVNLNDPAAVKAALADPKIAEGIRSEAARSAIPQAAANALSMAVGAKTMAPASLAGRPVAQQAVNIPAQAAIQGTVAAAGEAGSQAIIGEDLQGGRIAAAGIQGAGQGPVDVAVFAARKAWVHGKDAVQDVGRAVMSAKSVDDAINMAREVLDRPKIEAEVTRLRASELPADQVQGDILSLYGGLNEGEISRSSDGTYQYTKDGTTTPLREWDGVEREDTIPKALADAQRAAYEMQGVRVIHIDDIGRQVPFDGAVDPDQPNTMFLSTDPQRNAAMVGGHELVHIAERTALPDGRQLADEYFKLIQEGVTNTGLRQAYEVHGKTAPERSAFPDGPEGDSSHIDAVFNHLINELGADTGGEAPKFADYTSKVVSAVEARYGEVAAKNVLQKLMDGIRQTMDRLREFFFKPGEIGPPNTVSQNWLTNLGAVHDKLAEMQALLYGNKAGLEEARATGGVRITGTAQPPTPPRARAAVTYGEPELPPVGSPGPAPNSAYVKARTRVETLQRWLTDLAEQQRAAAADSPQARFLQQNIDAILKKVNGVEDRLTNKAAARLEDTRQQLDALLNPETDSPDMARVREQLLAEQQRMANAVAVGTPSPGMLRATQSEPVTAPSNPASEPVRGRAVMSDQVRQGAIEEARTLQAGDKIVDPIDGAVLVEVDQPVVGRDGVMGFVVRGEDGTRGSLKVDEVASLLVDRPYQTSEGGRGVDPPGTIQRAAQPAEQNRPIAAEVVQPPAATVAPPAPVPPPQPQAMPAVAGGTTTFNDRLKAEKEAVWADRSIMGRVQRGVARNEQFATDVARERLMREDAAPLIRRALDEDSIPDDAIPEIAQLYRQEDGEAVEAAFDRAVDRWVTKREAEGALLKQGLYAFDWLKSESGSDPVLAEALSRIEEAYAGREREKPGDENIPLGSDETGAAPARSGEAAARDERPGSGEDRGGPRSGGDLAAEEGPSLSPRKGDEPAFSPRQRLDLTEAEQNLRRKRGDAVLLEAYKLQQQRAANRRDILANTIQGWPATALLGRKIAEWREREAASGRTPALQPAGGLRAGEIPRGATVRIQTADGEVTAKLLSTDRPGGDAMTERKIFGPRSIKAIDVVDGRDTPSFSPRLAEPDATAPGEPTQLQREQQVVRLMEERRKAKQRAAETGDQIAEARQATNTAPTYGQKEAGNYLKGRVSFHGLPLVMENPEGSIRRGVDADGKPWAAKLPADYGYISRTEGADGDQVDAYIGPDHASQRVWVVDQIDPETGKFDEHKVMLGFQDLATARDAYHRAFSDGIGPERVGAVTEMPLDEFKAWLQDGDTRSPVGKIKRSGFDADAPPNERGVAFSPRIKDRDLERARKTVDGVVDEVRHGATGGSTESFGTVTRWLEKVAKLHGLDVTGYRHSIDVSAVRHVLRRHTNENIERSRGQVPVTDEDFRLIPEVLAAPDFLVFGEKSGRDHDIIGYIRRLDDGSLLYFEERRSDRQELAALSLRKFAAGTRAADIAGNLGLYARNDGGELTILPVRGRSSALQLPGPGDRPSFSPRKTPDDLEPARQVVDGVAAEMQRGEVATRGVTFGGVTQWLVEKAQAAGLDIAGFRHAIDVSALRHILKRHGDPKVEQSRGQVAVAMADIRRIPDVLVAPDFLVFGDKSRRGLETIGYGKRLPDGSILYFEELRSGRQELSALSLWKYPAGAHASQIRHNLGHHARSDGGSPKIVPAEKGSSALQLPGPSDRPLFSPRATGENRLRQYGIPVDATTITTFKSDEGIKAHRDYKGAKAGDPAAAARLVSALVRPEQLEMARTRFGPDALYVPVVAEEAAGHNAIPEMLAVYYSEVTGADVARSIRQTVRAFHTGADTMGRLIARPEFEGPVERGRRYVIVDDVSVLGGTLAELANHIQAGGGHVVGGVTLVNAGRSGQYAPRRGHVALIERRFGNEIREAFGVEPSALTADEVQYLVNFKDVDALRARRANAEGEREHRLRQKGVLPSEAQADVREQSVRPDDKPQFSPRLNEQDLERARATIDDVVEARRRGEVGTPAKSFGGVTPWLANLARKHGLEVAGYQHAIDVSAVRHIQNRHTNAAIELSRGQAPVRPQDLRLIPDILAAPDFLAFGDRTRRGFDTIGYGKKFSDGSLLYFEQRLSGKRKLAAVSLWRYPAGTHADQIKYSLTHHARSDGGAAVKVVAVDDQSSALQLPGPDNRPSFSPRQYGIPADAPTITTFKSDEGIKAHRDYKAAKSGDQAAAARLVSGLVRPEQVETALAKFGPDILYVPVVAEEATGHNAIPEFLARYYAEVTGADVARGIRQTVRAFHTGADAMGRLIARPEFEGPVEHGRSYVIVDDVSVLGGTLAELANHIQAGGGRIAGVVTLVNASRSGQYAPRRGHLALIERRFGNEIREAFGVEPGALTADEVQYLVNFKDADALRARRANAESERERRLREKGVLPSETQAEVRARGVEPDDKPQFSPRQDRRAPGFYSALTRAVENLKVEEMVPDQWRRTIQNLQGVKAAELRWVGLDDWLVERANRPSNGKPSSEKPITKQEILDFLQAHEIQVMEIEKGGGSPTRFKGKYRLSGGKGYRELLLLLPERAGDEPFESDHWTERNVLAHVRFDQRAGSHGERLLHVAEVQSDWHQGDRDQGYRPRTTSEIDRERRAVTAELLRKVPGLDIKNRPELDSALEANPDLWERLFDLQEERQKPPHSPFEKAWPELTMKRIIRYAAEHGYDRVTWDTGATTVKRYNLRRKLAKLHYGIDDSDGRFRIITKHRGGGIIQIRALEQDKLVDKLSRLVGRDLAERIDRGEGSPSQRHAWAKDIPGDGRLVGGHEMIGLYDDVLPNVVRKLGRRFGAEVADSWIENRNGRRIPVHGIDITPEMRQWVIKHGWPHLSPRQVADRPSQRAERNSFAAGRPLEPGMNRGIRIVTGGLEPSDEPARDLEDEQRRVRAMYFDALKRRAAQSLSVME